MNLRKSIPVFFVVAFAASFSPMLAQTDAERPVRKIEVTGSAEMEITPDEIYLSIGLQEYMKDNKTKASIENLEKDLQKAVLKAGIPEENFMIENVTSYNWNWHDKKKDEEFMAKKQYRIKLNDLNKINEIISPMEPKGIERMHISDYSHTNIEQFRRELKLKALQAAQEKAGYLLAGIDEQLGPVLEIQEFNDGYNPPMPYQLKSNMRMESAQDMAMPDIDFKTIKLRYEMRAVFSIL